MTATGSSRTRNVRTGVRMPFPGEYDEEAADAPPGHVLIVLVRQVEPGSRIRAAVLSRQRFAAGARRRSRRSRAVRGSDGARGRAARPAGAHRPDRKIFGLHRSRVMNGMTGCTGAAGPAAASIARKLRPRSNRRSAARRSRAGHSPLRRSVHHHGEPGWSGRERRPGRKHWRERLRSGPRG